MTVSQVRSTGTATPSALVRIKGSSPRWAKDAANWGTRRYGMATAGWRPLPDFLIVGTKRGGTTSMWNWLVEHPAVLPMFPAVRGKKSSDYFFDGGAAGERWYRSHFPTQAYRSRMARRLGHRVVTGEASPLYMYDPRICAQVADLMPDVRVIIQLRNPVKRAVSHWQERVEQGVEPLGFEAALAAEQQRTDGELDRMLADPRYYSKEFDWYGYRHRGIYAPQVSQWLSTFSADQILFVISEEFSADEQSVMNTVSDFLGVPRYQRTAYPRHNLSPKVSIDPAVLTELAEFYRPHNQELYQLLGRDLGWDA